VIAVNIGRILDVKIMSPKAPNVVVIVIDTIRADHLPMYGYKHNTSPFLSQLSTKSILCENAYSTSSWTSPSTASIFTSYYPFQHGVVKGIFATLKTLTTKPHIRISRIPNEIQTLAEIFRNYGYKTYGISDNLHICKAE